MTPTKTPPRLPDKLWQLLDLALNSALDLDPDKYKFNMGMWYIKSIDGTHCSVCMAGAVMVRVLGSVQAGVVMPSMFDHDTEGKLRAINFLREGRIAVAHEFMTNGPSSHDPKSPVYSVDHTVIEGAMRCKETPWLDNWSAHRALASELKRLDI